MNYIFSLSIICLSFTGAFIYEKITLFFPFFVLSVLYFFYMLFLNEKVIVWKWMAVMLYMLAVFLVNFQNSRIVSLFYSFAFIFYFGYVKHYMGRYAVGDFIKTLEAVIILFAVNTLVAQALVALGLNNDFLSSIFGTIYEPARSEYRYYAFSTEPSYASMVVISAYYAYYRVHKELGRKRKLLIDILVAYQIFAFGSIFGLVLLIAHLAVTIDRQKKILLAVLAVPPLILAVVLNLISLDSGFRFVRIIAYLMHFGFDIGILREIDSSAYMRFGPFLDYFYSLNLASWGTYFGHGAAASDSYFTDWFVLSLDRAARSTFVADRIALGYIPAFLYDYGMIGFSLVTVILVRDTVIKSVFSFEFIILLLMFTNSNFNTQLFCFVVTVLMLMKFYLGHGDYAPVAPGRMPG